MADLWDRLRAAQARVEEAPAVPGREPIQEPPPPGWTWAASLVAERSLQFPVEPRFWKAVGSGLDAQEWDQVLCFDTETTGLSGGAGTVAFLVGWARLVPRGEAPPDVEVRQWFLRDHPGEADLIAQVDAAWSQARGLVSFNGASFDLPLLRSRWTLAGRQLPEKPHRDDLHPARRLWKRLLDNCRLSRLEQTVLGLHRVDDVPGALVPALWFDYLREGAGPDFLTPLEGVLRHHAQDVYSLLCLDLVLGAMAQNPGHERWVETMGPFPQRQVIARPGPGGLLHPDLGPQTPVDFWGLLALKDPEAGRASLESAWEERDDEAVGMAWADQLKRRNDGRAAAIWTRLWEANRSYPALEELLKWLEHREKTPGSRGRALSLVTEALKAPFLPRVWRENLERRRDRLARILSSKAP